MKLHKVKHKHIKPCEKLAIHKFLVKGFKNGKYKYFYAANKEEAMEWIKSKTKLDYFEVYKAKHTFEASYFYE